MFVSLVSHALKNAITSMTIFEELLKKRLEKENDITSIKYLSQICVQTRKISHQINILLEQSKEGEKGYTPQDKLFFFDKLLQGMIQEKKRKNNHHNPVERK